MREPGHCSCSTHSTGHWQSISKLGLPLIDVPPLLGDECTPIDSRGGGLDYGGDNAPSDTPASHRNVRDIIGAHDSLHVPASAYSLRLRPAADRACQPGNKRNRHSREAHREEGRANIAPQTPSTYSKTTECSHRDRRTFSIRLLTCQLLANAPTVATKRQRDFSVQGGVIA